MNIFLTDQKANFSRHLDFLKARRVMDFDKKGLIEKETTAEINKRFEDINFQQFLDYNIFPNSIMNFLTQWEDEKRTMKIGDTIVQQAYLPPIKFASVKVVFGVRINEIFNSSECRGFSYETLEGHVEKGISTFTLERQEDKTIFKIHTFSTPGSFISKMVESIFSLPYQTYCTRQALKNVKRHIEINTTR